MGLSGGFQKEKGNKGFVVLGMGDKIMTLDPKKSEERSELEAVYAIASLLPLLCVCVCVCVRELLINEKQRRRNSSRYMQHSTKKVNRLNIEKSLCLIVVATNQSSFADVFSTECWKSCTRELFKGTLISES